eukprot:5703204-Pyramimonas_sp.AAC.1
MLANVIDIEHAAGIACLGGEDAAVILFDFTTAFPSISRRYLSETARAAGFPASAMEVLTSLYHMIIGTLLLHGQLHGRVPLETGIRQGCPLSPLLFALAFDGLLRIL